MSKRRPGSVTKNNHWVPEHQLRLFAASGSRKQIWQYGKDESVHLTSIRHACSSRGYFVQSIEDLLSTLEGTVAPAIEVLCDIDRVVEIDPLAKRAIAFYLAAFKVRSPAERKQLSKLATMAQFRDWGEEEMRMVGLPQKVQDSFREKLPGLIDKLAADPEQLMRSEWEPTNIVRWTLYAMSWTVLVVPEPIITIPDCGTFGIDIGLFDQNAELYLPISPRRVLVASWRGNPSYIEYAQGSLDVAKFVNHHGNREADRFVYGSVNSSAISHALCHPRRKAPKIRDRITPHGQNPIRQHLPGLMEASRKHFAQMDRECCMHPASGATFGHQWRTMPKPKPLVRDHPEATLPWEVCDHCQSIRQTLPNGYVHQSNTELLRKQHDAAKNWWEAITIALDQGDTMRAYERPFLRP